MGNGIEIYDISNPYAPVWLSTSKTDGRFYRSGLLDHWKVVVSNNIAYLENTLSGVYVYDVTDAAAPVRVDKVTVNIPVTSDKYTKSTNSKWVLPYDQDDHEQSLITSVTPINGYYYITSSTGDPFNNSYRLSDETKVTGKHRGLYVVESPRAKEIEHVEHELVSKSDNTQTGKVVPKLSGYVTEYYETDNLVSGIAKYNDYFILAEASSGFAIYDSEMVKLNEYSCKTCVRDLAVVDDYLYTLESGIGISTYKLNGNKAEFIKTLNVNDYRVALRCLQVAPGNDYIYVQSNLQKYYIFNIKNRENPKLEKAISTGSMYTRNCSTSHVANDKLAVSDSKSLTWYGINWNNELYTIYSMENIYYSERGGIAGYGEYAIQIYNNGYVYYKPEELARMPLSVAKLKKTITVSGAKLNGTPSVYGNMLMVSDSAGRKITFVDISNLDKPKLITQMKVDGNPDRVYAFDDELIVSLSHGGILRFVIE